MSPKPFVLQPFPGKPIPDGLKVTGEIGRQGPVLNLHYDLTGPLHELVLPPPADLPERRFALWESTCCEFFLAHAAAPGYWEFNLSPAGHWDAFRFSDYRQGMRKETALSALPVTVESTPDRWRLSLLADLTALGIANVPWCLALSVVLADRNGGISVWALVHPAPEADFHHRGGFQVELP